MNKFPRFKPAVLTIAALLAMHGSSAWANPVLSVSSAAEVNGNAGVSSPSGPDPVGSFTGQSDASGEASGSAFAASWGAYGVGSFATGGTPGGAMGEALTTLKYTLTNSNPFDAILKLTLKIYGGQLYSAVDDPNGLSSGESMYTFYDAKVTRVGAGGPAFASAARLDRDDTGTMLTQTGTTLSGATTDVNGDSFDSYSWATDYYTIELGLVAAGQSVDVLAELAGESFSNVGAYDFGGGGYECGYGGYETAQPLISEFGCFKGSTSQFYGDPFTQERDIFTFNFTPAAVPVPMPLLLMGLGLGALAWQRRKAPAGG